jgi:hypothetical protein
MGVLAFYTFSSIIGGLKPPEKFPILFIHRYILLVLALAANEVQIVSRFMWHKLSYDFSMIGRCT